MRNGRERKNETGGPPPPGRERGPPPVAEQKKTAAKKAAQKKPEEYSDLMVRVSGYSALFTSLGESAQNDVINRTEVAL